MSTTSGHAKFSEKHHLREPRLAERRSTRDLHSKSAVPIHQIEKEESN